MTGPGWLAFRRPRACAFVAHRAGDGHRLQAPSCVLPEDAEISTGARLRLKLAGQIPVRACQAPEWLGHLPRADPPRHLQLKPAA